MTTAFPGAIDAPVYPTTGAPMTNPSHTQSTANVYDAIVAIENYLGTSSRGVLSGISSAKAGTFGIVDPTTPSKVIGFQCSGMTASAQLTLASAQSTSQQLNVPNIPGTDTLATLGLAQTFTMGQTIASGTLISNAPGLSITQTWNAAGQSFTALSVSITNTASLGTSQLLNLVVGGSSIFNVLPTGATTIAASLGVATTITTTNGTIKAVQTAGSRACFAADTGAANVNAGYGVYNDGTFEWSVYNDSSNRLNIQDGVNTVNMVQFNQGLIGVGFVSFLNTTASSSATTGAVIISGGLGLGGALNTSGAIASTLASGNNQCFVTATLGNAQFYLQSQSGGTSSINFVVGGTTLGQVLGASGNPFYVRDTVNTWNPIVYQAGASTAGYVTFPGTLDASSTTVAAGVFSGGMGVAKSLQVGTSITAGSSISSGSRFIATGALTTYLGTAAVAMWRSGGTVTPNTGDLVFQMDSTTNGGANGFYFAGGTTGTVVNLLSLVGGTVATAVLNVLGTAAGTSATSASAVFSGGIGVAKTSYFGGNVVIVDNNNLGFGTINGTKLGTSTSQKIGFFNATPVVQPASPSGNTSTTAAGSITIAYVNTTFTGGSGSTAYTVGDIVIALKNLGLLAL